MMLKKLLTIIALIAAVLMLGVLGGFDMEYRKTDACISGIAEACNW